MGPERKIRHADHGVHRRADFVAHVGEELPFRRGRLFGAMLGNLQLTHQLCEPGGIVHLGPLRQFKFPRVAFEFLLLRLAVGDVARRPEEETLFRPRSDGPQQPAIRAVACPIAVLERHDGFTRRQTRRRRLGGRTVLGVDEVDVRSADHLLLGVAEKLRPRRVDPEEPSVVAGDTEEIGRQGEELIQPLLRLPLCHEQPDLAADGAKQFEQCRVRRSELAAEKFHHAANLAVHHQRKAERGVQAIAGSHLRPRKVAVLQHVRNPCGGAARPHSARQADARRKRRIPTRLDKGLEAERWQRPCRDAPQEVC